jgi:hypothetical protein
MVFRLDSEGHPGEEFMEGLEEMVAYARDRKTAEALELLRTLVPSYVGSAR